MSTMQGLERYITIVALCNAAIFYLLTVVLFTVAIRSRLNWALAAQKLVWLTIVLFIAMPSLVAWVPRLPTTYRMCVWSALSLCTWWVFYEVYRANWPGSLRGACRYVLCKLRRRNGCALVD